MPIYEYRCLSCQSKSSVFTRSMRDRVEPVCPQCGGQNMRSLVSTVAFKVAAGGASEDGRYRYLSNIGRHVEDSFSRFGVDMPDSVRKTIDDARRGKMPEGLDI